jgi:hypothetical protein
MLSMDKDFEGSRVGRVIGREQQIPENLFTQSPIHGSAAPKGKGNIFGSVDDFIRESALNTQFNSSKKECN